LNGFGIERAPHPRGQLTAREFIRACSRKNVAPLVSNGRLARRLTRREAWAINEDVISRDEVVALLFNVSDIARSLARIEKLLGGNDGEEEADEG
jgi:hypothetical protein